MPRDHDQIGQRDDEQPNAILVTVEGSRPVAACRFHSASTNGVKAKIMNGLKAWNQVTGICPLQN